MRGAELMKDVVLITNYWHFEIEKASSRYRTLAEMITEKDMSLEIITSSFYHLTKKQRAYSDEFLNSFEYGITLAYEKGYGRNISLQRVLSHRQFAKSVISYLKKRKRPDVFLLVVPSLDVADAVSKYAVKHKIPLVLDIQDLWPEAFRMAINIPILSNILFAPMYRKANNVYSRANRIIAVSNSYVERGLQHNKKDTKGMSVYLGTDLEHADRCMNACKVVKPDSEFWVTYIGSLGHSYDIKTVIDALSIVKDTGLDNIVFKVLGSGVLMKNFQSYADTKHISADFMGQTDYGKMMGILRASDLAVNPIIGSSVSSVINKVCDYSTAGLPVINTQNSLEYRELIDKYEAGINCKNGSANDVAKAIISMYHDNELRKRMSLNSRRLAEDLFDRRRTYSKIVKIIQDICL